MKDYYNEIDPYAAAWLRNLIAKSHIPPGDVDERSILDVRSSDLIGYRQCHFFAGIGGWPYALRLAGWPDEPVWTGSCPCQPLSSAGKRQGELDERHLWPAFCELIRQQRPSTIFGEQVASADGREWLSGIHADLEGMDYAFGAADLCAAGVGAFHIRQRLYWVADASHPRYVERKLEDETSPRYTTQSGGSERRSRGRWNDAPPGGENGGLADAGQIIRGWREDEQRSSFSVTTERNAKTIYDQRSGSISAGPWSDAEWIDCRDGKRRPVEPGTFPLAHGVSARVGRLRAYGNAIVPQVAAEFVAAFMEAL